MDLTLKEGFCSFHCTQKQQKKLVTSASAITEASRLEMA
jgi:hypothetical protein